MRKLLYSACTAAAFLLTTLPLNAQSSKSPTDANIHVNDRDGAVSSMRFAEGSSFTIAGVQQVFSTYLKLNPATDELRFKAVDKASDAISVNRFTQFFKGVKVEHGSYIVAEKNGVLSYMSGNFYRTNPSINTTPQLSEAASLQKALEFTGASKYIWEIAGSDQQLKKELNDPSATYAPKGNLVLVEDYYGGEEPDGILHLAWHFDIYATHPLSRNDVYVDAITGRILFTNSIIKHVQATGNSTYSGPVTFEALNTAGVFSLHDNTRGGGVNTFTLNDSSNISFKQDVTSTSAAFPSSVAIDAHWGAEKVYDYWNLKHNRLSYNNNNAPLNSYVNYSKNYNNAFWNGTAMIYGDGSGRGSGGFDPLVSLDICGHEIGHGVCQATAGLIYNRESGGMNEGFSDIWGAVIENYANPHETDAKAKDIWSIGEEISNAPLRDMINPNLYGDPDTYGGAYWKFATSNCNPNSNTNDQCGVHSNSGVLNRWFYVLTTGAKGTNDVGNAYEVKGVGIDTAAIIAYGTELSLTQTSNYAVCRQQSINYATAQFGACSKEVEAVIRAWYSVNVGSDYTSCNSQISFGTPYDEVDENASLATCPASHTVNVPVIINGPAPSGGNTTVTVFITGGTAINGVDYTIPNPVLTFPAGSTAPQLLGISVMDNGNTLDTGKYIELTMTLAANGSTAVAANVFTTTRIEIVNDDLAPVVGSTDTRTVGTSTQTANITSPFLSQNNQAHIQYIFTAKELLRAGLKPKATFKSLAFIVNTKASTQPYTNYTVQLAPTNLSIFSNSFVAGNFTTVYSSNLTTNSGINTLTFTNGYVWDGGNLALDICFTNTSRVGGNDQVQGFAASGNRAAFNANNSTSGGCNLGFIGANVSNARPVIRFTQDVAPTPIEATAGATRKWDVRAGDRTYFYSDNDQELIAGILDNAVDLGCVEATVSKGGNGFITGGFGQFSNIIRSAKEFTLTPSQNDTATYDGWFYLNDTELAGQSITPLSILHTTSLTDAGMTLANSELVSINGRIMGQNYTGFRGTIRGFGRFFFVDGLPNLAVKNTTSEFAGMKVINNPFSNDLEIAYTIAQNETVNIKLMDLTGKSVYVAYKPLTSGRGQITLPLSNLNLASGNYVLQIVSNGGVYTTKVLKN